MQCPETPQRFWWKTRNQWIVCVGKIRCREKAGCAKENIVCVAVITELCFAAFGAWHIGGAEQ